MLRFIKYFLLISFSVVVLAVVALFGLLWQANEPIPGSEAPVASGVLIPGYEDVGQQLTEILVAARRQHKLPSLSAAVAVGGQPIWAGAVGYRDVGDHVPAETDTAYRIGSISKSMTAALLVKLQQQGRLDMETPLGDYVGDIPPWSQVTLQQFASHQGGVRHYRDGFGMFEENFRNTSYPTTESSLVLIDQREPLFQPGSQFSYSTYGYTLLAYGMEKAAGADFPTLLSEELVSPLGLVHTALDGERASGLKTATPYIEAGEYNFRAPQVDLSYKYAGGGIVSTPTDVATFGSALLSGEYLMDSARDQLWRIAPLASGEPNDSHYAMGFSVNETVLGRRISHGGKSVGGTSYLAIYPEQDLVIAFTTNTISSDAGIDRELLIEQMAEIVLQVKPDSTTELQP